MPTNITADIIGSSVLFTVVSGPRSQGALLAHDGQIALVVFRDGHHREIALEEIQRNRTYQLREKLPENEQESFLRIFRSLDVETRLHWQRIMAQQAGPI